MEQMQEVANESQATKNHYLDSAQLLIERCCILPNIGVRLLGRDEDVMLNCRLV